MNKTVIRLAGAAVVGGLAFVATLLSQSPRLATGALLGVPAFVLMVISRRQLGNSFSMLPQARALVTTGLYSRIQHPMYVFLDLFLVAVIVAFDWPVLLWVWGILVVLQTLQSHREEKILAASFGADYESYRRRTWL